MCYYEMAVKTLAAVNKYKPLGIIRNASVMTKCSQMVCDHVLSTLLNAG